MSTFHYLSEQEVRILRALDDGRWHGTWDLAQTLDLVPFSARSSLRALRRMRLVGSGADYATAGQWRITDAGRAQLAQRQQMRLAMNERTH